MDCLRWKRMFRDWGKYHLRADCQADLLTVIQPIVEEIKLSCIEDPETDQRLVTAVDVVLQV